jgi:opacity protein-like surface antigen
LNARRNQNQVLGFKDLKERLILRKFSAMVFVLCLMSAAAMAQIPTAGNVFFGYSFNHGETGVTDTGTLNGWEASLEGGMLPHIGMVADISQQYGKLYHPYIGINAAETTSSVLFGPRVSFRVSKFRPYVHAMFGAGHLHEFNDYFGYDHSETSFADAIGGGVDYHLAPWVSWRVQLDALQTNFHSTWETNTRFATGLAVHF